MSSIDVLPRFLDALFYYPPMHPDMQAIMTNLSALLHFLPAYYLHHNFTNIAIAASSASALVQWAC
ncbi:MAG: hypothetical protein ACSLEN_01355 [Candidatus Malihini olakiniferum]